MFAIAVIQRAVEAGKLTRVGRRIPMPLVDEYWEKFPDAPRGMVKTGETRSGRQTTTRRHAESQKTKKKRT